MKISHGAIGLIDALGVRRGGDSGYANAEAILSTLEAGLTTAEKMKTYVEGAVVERAVYPVLGVRPSIAVLAFSDTIAISATLPESEPPAPNVRAMLVDVICQVVGYVQRRTAQMSRPLLYRGVVTDGPLILRGTSMLGAAIDEAAELYEQAEAAIVWLAPRASELPAADYGGPKVTATHPCDVPLKGGHVLHTHAVNPFLDQAVGIDERDRVREGYRNAMKSDALHVVLKRQNTMRFIDSIFDK